MCAFRDAKSLLASTPAAVPDHTSSYLSSYSHSCQTPINQKVVVIIIIIVIHLLFLLLSVPLNQTNNQPRYQHHHHSHKHRMFSNYLNFHLHRLNHIKHNSVTKETITCSNYDQCIIMTTACSLQRSHDLHPF